MGFLETVNNSMVSRDHISLITPDVQPVEVQKPINPATPLLRTNIIGGLLDSVQWNKNRSEANLKLFEIGRIFRSKGISCLPNETDSMGGLLTGLLRSKPFWGEPDTPINFFHLKGLLESLMEGLHIPSFSLAPETHDLLKHESSMHIMSGEQKLGFMGEVNADILEHWDIPNAAFVFELDLEVLYSLMPQHGKFQAIPKFPAVKRDLAIVMDEDIPTHDVKETIQRVGGDNLVSVNIFDLYRGPQIPQGKKSVAFSMQFLSMNRTLKEEDVDPVIVSIMETLEASYSASLRS
jgi:phenylalanyl-tRNA synthetase beta chain